MRPNAEQIESGVSVVVPVFDGSETLGELLDRLEPVLRGLGRPFEVLLVNDGSRDASWGLIQRRAAEHSWVRGINLMRNYGQHNALLCGLRLARYSATVTMDDDLQNPPEELPKLVHKLDEGHDVVYGAPRRPRHSVGHVAVAKILRLALAIALGAKTARIVSPFRAIRTQIRTAFEQNRSPWVILDVFLVWSTTRIVPVTVEHEKRQRGKVSYTFRKRFVQALDMITGFSTLPLKLAAWVGFCFTLFGVAVLVYVVSVVVLQGGTVPGFAFLASTIAIFSGAQLFALGILGEYLARMFDRVMERPAYVVRETTS